MLGRSLLKAQSVGRAIAVSSRAANRARCALSLDGLIVISCEMGFQVWTGVTFERYNGAKDPLALMEYLSERLIAAPGQTAKKKSREKKSRARDDADGACAALDDDEADVDTADLSQHVIRITDAEQRAAFAALSQRESRFSLVWIKEFERGCSQAAMWRAESRHRAVGDAAAQIERIRHPPPRDAQRNAVLPRNGRVALDGPT